MQSPHLKRSISLWLYLEIIMKGKTDFFMVYEGLSVWVKKMFVSLCVISLLVHLINVLCSSERNNCHPVYTTEKYSRKYCLTNY